MVSTLGAQNPFRYRGYVYDTETGLYYLQSRYYDPDTGRFISADGYILTGSGLLDANMFLYCVNNPLRYNDNEGNCYYDVNGEWKHDNWEFFGNYPIQNEPKLNSAEKNSPDTYVYAGKNEKPNFTPRNPKKKGSEKRKKTGNRERNVGHPNGEEHSRVPKGNNIRRYSINWEAVGQVAGASVLIVVLVADEYIGITFDDYLIVPVATYWLESANNVFS